MFAMAFPMLALAYDTNGLFIGQAIETGDVKACVAGSSCGGTLLGTISGHAGSKTPPYAHGLKGYFGLYGTGQFDGQGSGHDFWGTVSFTEILFLFVLAASCCQNPHGPSSCYHTSYITYSDP
jgi:hypothetical protein